MPDIRWSDSGGDHTSYRYAMFTYRNEKYVVVRHPETYEFIVRVEGSFETVGGKGVRPTPPSHRIK